MPVRVAGFAPLQVFAEWCQKVPKWASKLQATVRLFLNVSSTGLFLCNT